MERRADGSILLRSGYPLGDMPRTIADLFAERAVSHAGQPFIRQRGADGAWRGISYGEAWAQASTIARWLLTHGASPDHGVVILSGNSAEHASIMLGCFLAGVPSAALSQAYSLSSGDLAKLRHCFAKLEPRVVFAQGATYARAIDMLRQLDPAIEVVTVDGSEGHAFASLIAVNADFPAELPRVEPETVAKYLFTSGSTGIPKAVPQTHRMMAAMIGARTGILDGDREVWPPSVVDWMPWSHLSAGNINFNQNLWAGGTLYIDDGRPIPGQFDETVRNFVELSPEQFSSAPIAFEMIASALEADSGKAKAFFRNLRWMAYGGATLSQEVAERLQRLAVAAVGRRVPIVTTYGATEVQGITSVYWVTDQVGLVGLPLPGVELKLAPVGDKLEVRARGAGVLTHYHREPALSAAAFDDEGFYCLGDAARLVDPDNPLQGLMFDGRITEDFKLSTGTWVSVGTLRPDLLTALSPLVRDAVIAGQDRSSIGALIWLSEEGRQTTGVSGVIAERLRRFNQGSGSARRVRRAVLLDMPPSVPDGEITEKGYVNQRAVLARRGEAVRSLYAEPLADGVIEASGG
ncbi:MAG: AMP-binding protein [Pseudomonadota bacterium]